MKYRNRIPERLFLAKNQSVESTGHETGLHDATSQEVSIKNTDEGSKAESVNSKMLGSRSFHGSRMIPVTKEFCKKVLFFTHHGHLQALKVRDLKVLCLSQLCDLKARIIEIGS
jgi:hypothetical protein